MVCAEGFVSLQLLFLFIQLLLGQGRGTPRSVLTAYQPAHISVPVGSPVTLHCSFNYTGDHKKFGKFFTLEADERKYIKEKNQSVDCSSDVPHADRSVCKFSITTENIRPENETVYYCEVKIPLSNTDVKGSGTRVSVYAEPSTTAVQVSSLLVAGEENSLSCSVTGFYPESISVLWFRGDAPAPLSSTSPVLTSHSNGTFSVLSSVSFTPTAADHGAEYSCEASHPAWRHSVRGSTTLDVKYGPRAVNVTLLSAYVGGQHVLSQNAVRLSVGAPLAVSCSADGNPPPRTEWVRAGEGVLTGGETGPGQTPLIEAVQKEHEGVYWCVAENSYGQRNVSFTLHVSESPALSGYIPLVYGLITVPVLLLLVIIIVCLCKNNEFRKKEKAHGAQPLSGQESQRQTAPDEGQASTEGGIYAVPKTRKTKRRREYDEVSKPIVDETQLIYADIIFQPSPGNATGKKKLDPDCTEAVYSTIQKGRKRPSRNEHAVHEQINTVYTLAEMPQHGETHCEMDF
uniref:Roundabout homolog 3-like n=1 Tax=Lepisosteus oculatus TaxID=7918 RepID=W5M5L9_LEPOC|nr:PREDICTED: sialic acid-binding Ig-like lectin 13 isoform X1 [Lepisosteus oculatus]XP_015192866.1 PREDICTED: sialic acid-binding Ig-like lectin 13 isoform X1 [Lepisosteus oculatus]